MYWILFQWDKNSLVFYKNGCRKYLVTVIVVEIYEFTIFAIATQFARYLENCSVKDSRSKKNIAYAEVVTKQSISLVRYRFILI
mgnify:CR=1 FL=1